MKSLFFKIFLCIWLSHMMAVALTFGVLTAALSRREDDDRRRAPSTLPSATLVRHVHAVAALLGRDSTSPSDAARREAEREAVAAYLNGIERESSLRAVFFDAAGREISGRRPPWGASALAARAARSDEVEFAASREGLMGARRIRAPDGAMYVLVAQRPRMRPGPPGGPAIFGLRGPQFFEAARFFGILVASGIVAFGLARYLTAPTVKLRRATNQLAGGDLSARVGAQMGRRRDELADLGRDFDLMAERIQSLLLAERRLLGDISHELRSPLARLQVALDLSLQSADAPTREFLERIERESGRLNALIGQLLTLTRLETIGAEARREPVNLAHLLAEVASDADFEASGHDRAVRVIATQKCWTAGNVHLLRSAVENVIRNAVRYTRAGTNVEISLIRKDESKSSSSSSTSISSGQSSTSQGSASQAVIRVRDQGPGVPPEALEHLFRPFYRVADARDRQSGGVGLGLSIAERAVRFHGGEVTAVNAPGGGLLVEIRLPLVEPPLQTSSLAEPPLAASPSKETSV